MTAQKGTQIVDRARLCLSLHLMTLLRKFMWRKLRKSRSYITSHSGVHSGAVRGGASATSSCKVGPESGAFFLLYAPGANPSCFGVILGCMGCAHLSGQVCISPLILIEDPAPATQKNKICGDMSTNSSRFSPFRIFCFYCFEENENCRILFPFLPLPD